MFAIIKRGKKQTEPTSTAVVTPAKLDTVVDFRGQGQILEPVNSGHKRNIRKFSKITGLFPI